LVSLAQGAKHCGSELAAVTTLGGAASAAVLKHPALTSADARPMRRLQEDFETMALSPLICLGRPVNVPIY
jgi:hypothetical protein